MIKNLLLVSKNREAKKRGMVLSCHISLLKSQLATIWKWTTAWKPPSESLAMTLRNLQRRLDIVARNNSSNFYKLAELLCAQHPVSAVRMRGALRSIEVSKRQRTAASPIRRLRSVS